MVAAHAVLVLQVSDHPTSVRHSSKGWPDSYQTALHKDGASPDSISQLHHDIEAMHALTAFRYLRPCIDLLAAEMLSAAGDSRAGLRLLAETQPFIEQWEQRLSEAEFHRVRAQLLLATGAAASEAEVSLARAIDIARSQSAKIFELRAATSLAQLWRDQNKRAEARDLLGPIYGWFTEGFDMPDLQRAKSLLDELAG